MRRTFIVIVLGLIGCEDGGSSGALGQAHFSTDCSPADQSCLSVGLHAPIAEGGQVKLDVAVGYAGAAAPALTLTPVDTTVLQSDGTKLTGVAEGLSALLVTGPGSRVIDFIHVWVRTPSELGIHRLGQEGTDLGKLASRLQVLADERVVVDVRPYREERELLGSIPAQWSVSSDAVTLLDPGLGTRRHLIARKPGSARVTVKSGEKSAHVDLEVLP
jgi:hypothetical protein